MLLNDKVAVINGAGGEIAGAADPAARGVAAANAFHAAFWVIFVLAALGALTPRLPSRGAQRKRSNSSRLHLSARSSSKPTEEPD